MEPAPSPVAVSATGHCGTAEGTKMERSLHYLGIDVAKATITLSLVDFGLFGARRSLDGA